MLTTELMKQFNDFAQKNGLLLEYFHDTFLERAVVPGSDESRGRTGLTEVLASLLTLIPSEEYFVTTSETPRDMHLEEDFRAALLDVATQYPRSITRLETHSVSRGSSVAEMLKALFAYYADNKMGYPF